MNNVIEKLKKIPMPVWIGLGIIILFILFMGRKQTTTAGPVTGATVGAQGAQPNAGTDQQLGNLSQINQTGFSDILRQQRAIGEQQSSTLNDLISRMNAGAGTTMTAMGSAIQGSQNTHATGVANQSGVQGGYGATVTGSTQGGVLGSSTVKQQASPSAGGSGNVINYYGHTYDLSTSVGRAQLTSDASNNVVPAGPGGTNISRLINGTG